MNRRKKAARYIMGFLVHLLLAVGAILWYLDLPAPWLGALSGLILGSLFAWPIRWVCQMSEEEYRRWKEGEISEG